MGREKGSGMNWKGVDSNARCDKTRQNSFFFPNEKKRKLCKKKRRRAERGERGGVFDFFQRYYKLSECSCYYCNLPNVCSCVHTYEFACVVL